MKNLSLILFSMLLLLTACSDDEPTDFLGTYTGEVTCIGEETESQMTTIMVTSTNNETFIMTIAGESSFEGTANDNVLTIEQQTPIDADFEPLFEATLTENEDGTFTLIASLDEDGELSNCSATLVKQ